MLIPGPPPDDPPEYVDRDTELPPLTVMPDFKVGVSGPDTTNVLPAALSCVLKAYVLVPTVSPYKIPFVNDDAL